MYNNSIYICDTFMKIKPNSHSHYATDDEDDDDDDDNDLNTICTLLRVLSEMNGGAGRVGHCS